MQQKDKSPLAGMTVLVTRPEAQAGVFLEKLERLKAKPVLFPAISIAPPENYDEMDSAIGQLAGYDWVIFTSVNGVRYFTDRMRMLNHPVDELKNCRIAAIGPATAAVISELGLVPEFVPTKFVAEIMAGEFPDVKGKNLLMPRADIARSNLREDLEAKGAKVKELVAYRTSTSGISPEVVKARISQQHLDIITFTSSSTVRHFHEKMKALDLPVHGARIACIGPITAKTARQLDYDVWVEAETYTVDGLINSMEKKLADEKQTEKAKEER